MRDIILFQCTECKERNYSTMKNKKNTTEKLQRKNTAGIAESTHRIRRQSHKKASSSNGRASDSKSGGWGVQIPPGLPL